MNILVLYSNREASAVHEIYFKNVLSELYDCPNFRYTISDIFEFEMSDIKNYDYIFVCRIIDVKVVEIIKESKKHKKNIFYFLDDHILGFPKKYYLGNVHFYKQNRFLIKFLIKTCDGLVVSNEQMKKTYYKYNKNIFIIGPNIKDIFLEDTLKDQHKNDLFTIGYAGSFGHSVDFAFLEETLLSIYKKYKPNIKIDFWGCVPSGFINLIDGDNVNYRNFNENYLDYLKELKNARWDIALCPIMDDFYTSHKSNIKFIEYSATNKIGVYSDISIYNKDIINGRNGFCVKNEAKEWEKIIEYCYKNRDKILELSSGTKKYVDKYRSSIMSKRFIDMLVKIKKSNSGRISLINKKDLFFYKIESFLYNKINLIKKIKKLYHDNGLYIVCKRIIRVILNNIFTEIFVQKQINKIKNFKNQISKRHVSQISLFIKKNIKKNQKPNILFLIPWMTIGGGDKVNLDIAHNLDKKRFTLHYITTEKSKNEWDSRFRNITQNIFHIPDLLSFNEYPSFILEYIRMAKIDCIIISNSAVGYNCLPVIKEEFPSVKIIDILHGEGGENEGGGFPKFSYPYDKYLNNRVVISDYLKNLLIKKYNINDKKISVIKNGIDIQYFDRHNYKTGGIRKTFGIKQNKKIITYIGRLAEEKHPERIIEIAKKLTNKDYIFLIAGDGPMLEEVKNLITNNQLQDNVLLLGTVNDIPSLLMDTDILLLVSEIEGIPIVILEALAMEVPVISTKVGGIPEMIENYEQGVLIDQDNQMIDNFCKNINLILNDTDLYTKLKNNTRKKIEESFSMDKAINDYIKILK